jgi:flagellar biosynthesis/type III secretory pathway M-ring protein FliF/YscJ
MMFTMIPVPPMHGPVTLTVAMFWGMVAFVLALLLLVILWVIWVVGSQRRAQRQSQMKEAARYYEASPQPQSGEQPQVPAPEEEKILLRR